MWHHLIIIIVISSSLLSFSHNMFIIIIWSSSDDNNQVEIGGNALIECLTAAHPKSLNFWHDKNDLFIRSDQRWFLSYNDDFLLSISRNDKYISTVEEGTPSYYNALMRLQILNVSCKTMMVLISCNRPSIEHELCNFFSKTVSI